MEFCGGGALSEVLKRAREKPREQDIAYILENLLLALDWLHSHGIVHRDVKVFIPGRILSILLKRT